MHSSASASGVHKIASCELHGKDLGAAFDTAIAREPKTRTLVPQLLATGDASRSLVGQHWLRCWQKSAAARASC